MAIKDVNFYKDLGEALKHKYRFPDAPGYLFHSSNLGNNRFDPTIFKWVQSTLDTLHNKYGINYSDYRNIADRLVLEKLVENIAKDPRLGFLNNPTLLEVAKFELPDEFYKQVEQDQVAQQQAAAQAPSAQSAGPLSPAAPTRGAAMPQMPAFPTSSQAPPEQPPKGETAETEQKPSQEGQTPQMGRRGFNLPRMPNFAKNARSNAGIVFKKTTSRAAVAASKGMGAALGRGGRAALGGINAGIHAGIDLSNEISRLRVGTLPKKWLLGLLLPILLFLILVVLIIPSGTQLPSPSAPPTTGTDISQCIFYRGGDSIPGLKYLNPVIPQLVSDISTKVGVPPALVAGIMRVESATVFLDPAGSDYIINDYDAHCSLPSGTPQTFDNCVQFGIAFGLMQFTPNTFLGVFTRDQSELQTLFSKTDATKDIVPQDQMALANVFRIYSIKDSITAAAFKVRDDKRTINGDGPWDETTVFEIARRYYGALEYIGFDRSTQNYGADLWKSYTECKPTGGGGTLPPPGQGAASIASFAEQLAKLLVYSVNPDGSPAMAGCNPGGSFGPSFHCWPLNLMTCYDQASDPDYVQCTEFVWGVFDQAGYGSQIDNVRRGNASDWPTRATGDSRFQVFYDFSQVQIADIISLGEGGVSGTNTVNGHVMVIISRENNVIRVGQASTSQAIESFQISDTPVAGQCSIPDQAGHLLIFPIGDCPGPSGARNALKGIIRLTDFGSTKAPMCTQ